MNSKAVKIMIEVVVAVAISVGLSYIPQENWPVMVDFAVFPLLFVSLRQGSIWGVIASVIFGILHWVLHPVGGANIVVPLVDSVLAYGFVGGIAGLFARNTVRTAFNARTSSTTLNIVTASFLATLMNFVCHAIASAIGGPTFFFGQQVALITSLFNTWPTFLATLLVAIVIFVGALYLNRSLYIPKGTRFLTRKEQSHLLND